MSSNALKAAATGHVARPQRTIFDYLEHPKVKSGIAAVAGKFLTPERMLTLCVNAVKKTPRLLECDPQTVLGAMMTSAALGLEPNTVQQQAFLIPYKKRVNVGGRWVDAYECQFQIGYRGFITLGYRSRHIKRMSAGAVHEGDLFEHMEGSSTFLKFAKSMRDRGELIGAFSHVLLEGNEESAYVLPLDEILKIRGRSETYNSLMRNIEEADSQQQRAKAEKKLAETPWVLWQDDMAAKSAVKKHAKWLPIAAGDALAVAAEIDNRAEAGVIDMAAMADPDVVRSVIADESSIPEAAEEGDAQAQQPAALPEPQQPAIVVRPMVQQPERVPVQQQADNVVDAEWEPSAEELAEIQRREREEAAQQAELQQQPQAQPARRAARAGGASQMNIE